MSRQGRSEAELLRVIAEAEEELRYVRRFNEMERIRALEEENRQLKAAMRGKPYSLDNRWGLNPGEIRMLAAFAVAPRNQIILYSRLIWGVKSPIKDVPTSPTVLKTTLYNLRKKVPDLKVKTIWGQGFVVEAMPEMQL